jgi:hypothetical protein
MHLRCSLAAAVVVLALSSSPARAEEKWYGYQVAAPDVGGWLLVLVGAQSDAWGTAALGVGGILLGGPIVHAAHGHWGSAGKSLGLRVGAPLVGATLGAGLGVASGGGGKGSLDAITYAIVGAGIGYVAAAAIDIIYLAREDVPDATPRMFSIGGRF